MHVQTYSLTDLNFSAWRALRDSVSVGNAPRSVFFRIGSTDYNLVRATNRTSGPYRPKVNIVSLTPSLGKVEGRSL